MKLTITISNWNRDWLLDRSIYLMSKQTMSQNDWELIIVDDGSTDESEKVIKRYKEMNIIKNFHYIKKTEKREKYGNCSIARNIGGKAGVGNYILFTDPEVMVMPDWAEQHYLAHQERTDIDVLGLCLHPREYHIVDDSKGCRGPFLGNAYVDYDWYNITDVWNTMNEKIRKIQDDYGLNDDIIRSEFFLYSYTQAGHSVSRKSFLKVGGFEENFCNKGLGLDKYGGEDIIFHRYLGKIGNKRLNLSSIRAIHIYHDKVCQDNVSSDYAYKYDIEHLDQCQANLGRDWGLIEENGFMKVF